MKKVFVLFLTVLLVGFSAVGISSLPQGKDIGNEIGENSMIVNKLERLKRGHNGNAANKNALNAEASVASVERLSKDEVAFLAVREINSGVAADNYFSLENSFIVTDFSDNEYLYTAFKPYGSSVISMFNYTTVEVNYFDKDDYSGFTDADGLKYIPSAGLYKLHGSTYENVFIERSFSADNAYIAKKGSSTYIDYMDSQYDPSIDQKISLLNTNGTGGGGGSGRKSWDIDVANQVINADKEVPYSWFFKYNTTQFSYHSGGSNGICEYIAFLMIMEYHDFFSSAGYFSNSEISKYVTTVRGTNFLSSIPIISDQWCVDLYDGNNKKETLNAGDLNSLSDNFLKNKGKNYNNIYAYWTFGNPRDVIENGKRPDMMSGYFPDTGNRGDIAHNIIAYGVFTSGTYKGKYLTHYGWEGHTQCIVERPFASAYDWSVKNNSSHIHRYIFDVYGVMKCGCGQKQN